MKSFILLLLISSCTQFSNIRKPSSLDSSHVNTVAQLREMIARANNGDTIKIDQYMAFNMTDETTIVIDKSITIMGYPDPGEDKRAHFFSFGKPLPMFKITAPNVTISGIKFEGTETDSKKSEIIELNRQGIKGVYKFPVIRGLDINASNVIIKNCEFKGFSHAAIFISDAKNILIEENYIHHNQRWGLGYGVTLNGASTAKITRNTFNYNRHSIAGTGHSGQSYEASYNWFGPNHNDTPLDMHGGKDRKDGTQIAGKKVDIHHNRILTKNVKAFIHRGIPEDSVLFYKNVISTKTIDATIGYYNGVTKSTLPAEKFKYFQNAVDD